MTFNKAGNPYLQYALIIHLLGGVALEMKKRAKLNADNYGLYYDGDSPGSRIYIGDKSMINKMLMAEVTQEVIQDLITLHSKESVDMAMLHLYGPEFKPHTKSGCTYCNGFGIWPHDRVPLTFEEVTWIEADPCDICGSINSEEYLAVTGQSCSSNPNLPWENSTSIGFHAALKNFSRSIKCAELLDTQDTKTASA